MQKTGINSRFLAMLLALVISFVSVPASVFAGENSLMVGGNTIYDTEQDNTDTTDNEQDNAESEDNTEKNDTENNINEEDNAESKDDEDNDLEEDIINDEAEEDEGFSKELPELPALDNSDFITVYISFEGYTLGHGFYIEPVMLNIPSGSTIETVTGDLLSLHGYAYTAEDQGSPYFELTRIYGFNAFSSIPLDFISDIPNLLDGGSSDGSLGSGDYTALSGWKVTLNHVLIDTPGSYAANDGDVIRWQFSLQEGTDLGIYGPMGWPLYEHTDKTELIRALFNPWSTEETKQLALSVIIDPFANEEDVEFALDALLGTIAPAMLLSVSNPNDAMAGALRWLRTNISNPGVNNEWAVLARARGAAHDANWYGIYLANLYEQFEEGPLANITDYARVTLALSALGLNASNHSGRNFTAPFSAFPSQPQNANTYIFALLALDSGPYYGVRGHFSGVREQYVNAIISEQRGGGFWVDSWFGDPDIDATAQAVQALAPYSAQPSVAAAINFALNWLSGEQTENGGWMPWGTYSAESAAQVVVALTTLGIDPQTDSRFIKNGINPITALLSLQDTNGSGGFTADWGDWGGIVVNEMSTEQAAYALVAYHRFINNMNALYDMRDAGNIAITLPDGNSPGNPGSGGPSGPSIGTAFIFVRDDNADPGQTSLFFEGYIDVQGGETAYSLLVKTGLSVVERGGYVVSISGLSEFDAGLRSGWVFSVNGRFPGTASANIPVNSGDTVEWLFTRDLGLDVGAGGDFGEGSEFLPGAGISPVDGRVTLNITAVAAGRTAIARVSPLAITELIALALEKNASEIAITITTTETANRVEADLGMQSLIAIVENNMSLTIRSKIAAIAIDEATLAAIVFDALSYESVEDLTVKITAESIDSSTTLNEAQQEKAGDSPVTLLAITIGDTYIGNFEGLVTVTLPYTPSENLNADDYGLITVFHIDEEANVKEMSEAAYKDGEISFATNHFSLFFISETGSFLTTVVQNNQLGNLYNSKFFSNGDDLVLSETYVSRAMLIHALWQLAGEPAPSESELYSFLDVPEHQWYYGAVTWASETAVIRGRDNGLFSPDDYVTYEELVVIIYNYAKNRDLSLAAIDYEAIDYSSFVFTFDLKVAAWAVEAMAWADSIGLMEHTAIDKQPASPVNRSEIITILHIFTDESAPEEE